MFSHLFSVSAILRTPFVSLKRRFDALGFVDKAIAARLYPSPLVQVSPASTGSGLPQPCVFAFRLRRIHWGVVRLTQNILKEMIHAVDKMRV